MMKLVLAAFCAALVVAVPVSEVPQTPAVEAPAPAVAEVAKPAEEDPLKQVISLVQKLADKMPAEEQNSLKEMLAAGQDIITKAEVKARDITTQLETSNLLQSDNILGIKQDGTIDADVAADQITSLINIFAGPNTVTPQDKDMMHQVISAVSGFLNPLLQSASDPSAAAPAMDFTTIMPLVKLMMPPTANKNELPFDLKTVQGFMQLLMPPMQGKHDSALGAQSLVSLDKDSDVAAVSDLVNKFADLFDQLDSQ